MTLRELADRVNQAVKNDGVAWDDEVRLLADCEDTEAKEIDAITIGLVFNQVRNFHDDAGRKVLCLVGKD